MFDPLTELLAGLPPTIERRASNIDGERGVCELLWLTPDD